MSEVSYSYEFVWKQPADNVKVIGSFDNWSGGEDMVEKHGVWQKELFFPKADKIWYKFLINGEWHVDPTARTERDEHGNNNNYILPSDLEKHHHPPTISSTAGRNTSTAALAGQVPLEKDTDKMPGGFATTPGEEKTLSVNPLPATDGPGNPIKLAPGEKVPDPSTFTSNTVSSTATTDRASYEAGGSSFLDKAKEHGGAIAAGAVGATAALAAGATFAAKKAKDSIQTPDAFKDDPVSAPGAPSSATSSQFHDPRTMADAFSQDPLSPNDQPAAKIESDKPTSLTEKASAAAAAAAVALGGTAGVIMGSKNDSSSKDVFKDDPVSAGGPSMAISSHFHDPRTVADAFENDPLSPNDKPASKIIPDIPKPSTATATGAGAAVGAVAAGAAAVTGAAGVGAVVAAGAAGAGVGGAAAGGAAALSQDDTFKDDPISAGGPQSAVASEHADPRTIADAFNQDPLSPNDKPAAKIVPDSVTSAAPGSTTNQLAGQVPKEPRGEATVENDSNIGTIGAVAAGGVVAAGAGGALAYGLSKDDDKPADAVPDTVSRSLDEAKETPSAAASAPQVDAKKETERELQQKVVQTDSAGEPAPTSAAATSSTAPAPTNENDSHTGAIAAGAVGGAALLGGGAALAATSQSGTTTPNIVDEDTMPAIALAQQQQQDGRKTPEPDVVMTDRAAPLSDQPDPTFASAHKATPTAFDNDPIRAEGGPDSAVPSSLADPRTISDVFTHDPINPDGKPAQTISSSSGIPAAVPATATAAGATTVAAAAATSAVKGTPTRAVNTGPTTSAVRNSTSSSRAAAAAGTPERPFAGRNTASPFTGDRDSHVPTTPTKNATTNNLSGSPSAAKPVTPVRSYEAAPSPNVPGPSTETGGSAAGSPMSKIDGGASAEKEKKKKNRRSFLAKAKALFKP